MQKRNFTKEKFSFTALFLILMTATTMLMTACQTTVNPASPGIATVTKTPTTTPTVTNTTVANATATPTAPTFPNPGSIDVIGWDHNANAEVGFIAASNIAGPATIYFTNLSWDKTLNTGAGGFYDQSQTVTGGSGVTEVEVIVSYAIPSGQTLNANTPVYFGNTGSNATNSLGAGTLANTATFQNSSPSGSALTGGSVVAADTFIPESKVFNGDKLLVFTVPSGTTVSSGAVLSSGVPNFVNAIILGPDAFTSSALTSGNYWDSGLPSPLTTSGVTPNAVDLSTAWNDAKNSATYGTVFTASIASGQGNQNGALNANVNGCQSASWAACTSSYWSLNVGGKTSVGFSPAVAGTNCSVAGFTFTAAATAIPY
jgi:hypothetical protein